MSVLFAALLGGFALGQAAPNIQFFTAGKVAGGRVLGMIQRWETLTQLHVRSALDLVQSVPDTILAWVLSQYHGSSGGIVHSPQTDQFRAPAVK